MADYSDLTLEELMQRMEEVINSRKTNTVGEVIGLEQEEFRPMVMEVLQKTEFVLVDRAEERWLVKYWGFKLFPC